MIYDLAEEWNICRLLQTNLTWKNQRRDFIAKLYE